MRIYLCRSSHRKVMQVQLPQSTLWLLWICLLMPPLAAMSQQTVPGGWTATQQDGNTIYHPGNLSPGQTFTMTVGPFRSLQNQSFETWFQAETEADLAKRGRGIGQPQKKLVQNGVLTQTQFFTDTAGKRWFVMYSGTFTNDGRGQFASMVTDMPVSASMENIRTGATIVGQNLKNANSGSGNAAPLAAQPSDGGTKPAMSPANTARPSQSGNTDALRVATAGSGVPPSQIEALMHEGRGVSTAMGFQYQESADLLLKDGWEYSSLDLPPEDLNVDAARRLHPERWHHWRRQGNDVYIQDQKTGQWSKLDAMSVRPLEQRLSVHLVHRNSYSFGGMGSYNTANDITFSPDGRFERSSNVLAGSGAVQSAGGFSGGSASHQDRNGRSATSSGTYSGGGGSVGTYSRSQSRSGDGNAYGTYKISGYTLELDSAGGQVQRLLAFYPFIDKPTEIFLNDTTFSRR